MGRRTTALVTVGLVATSALLSGCGPDDTPAADAVASSATESGGSVSEVVGGSSAPEPGSLYGPDPYTTYLLFYEAVRDSDFATACAYANAEGVAAIVEDASFSGLVGAEASADGECASSMYGALAIQGNSPVIGHEGVYEYSEDSLIEDTYADEETFAVRREDVDVIAFEDLEDEPGTVDFTQTSEGWQVNDVSLSE